MKTIRVEMDETVLKSLVAEAGLRDFVEGCVAPPSILEKVMMGIVRKMAAGDEVVTVAYKAVEG